MIILGGYLALWAALLSALFSVLCSALGARLRRQDWLQRAERSFLLTGGLLLLATASLLYLLLTRNFQVQYVYAHTSSYQPTLYVISALWAGQEGSLLLWALLISLIAATVITQKRQCSSPLWPYILATLAVVQGFFALLLITVQNPFVLFPLRPPEGAGLTPLLENPAMVIHPPVLFLGYAMYTVPFAFALAGLLAGELERSWLPWIRRWSLLAWLSLTLGIAIGAWWAYVELGWGGYWSWDPVENASLTPWLVGTAYLHSLMAQERQNTFKRWNLALPIAAFLLCLFATLVTRGGIIVSDLHGFARSIQPIAYYLIGFILAICLISAVLFHRRRQQLEDRTQPEHLLSRESGLLISNLLFIGLAVAILVGMLFPSLAQVMQGTSMYLGSDYYNRVFAPLALAVVLLIGVCPLLGWGQSAVDKLVSRLRRPALAALAIVAALPVFGVRRPFALLSLGLVAFAAFALCDDLIRQLLFRIRQRGLLGIWSLWHSNRRRYGGRLVHLAILLLAIGITGSSLYKRETLVALTRGASTTIQDYVLQYEGTDVVDEVGRRRYIATVGVYRGSSRIATLRPEKNMHWNIEQFVTEVAIRSNLVEDLYIALDWPEQDGRATFRISVYPLVIWLWIGVALLLLGTLIAIWPTAAPQQEQQHEPGTA